MRPLIVLLVFLLVVLQWQLWFSAGGLRERALLKRQTAEQVKKNQTLKSRNAALEREVEDLKKGDEVIERRAREDLGLIKNDEIFYQYIDQITSKKESDDITGDTE